MRLLAGLAALWLPLSALAAGSKSIVVPSGPLTLVAPAAPTVAVPGASLGGLPTLPYAGADLRYDPAVQSAMANPVPATAQGLKAAYFQPLPSGAVSAAHVALPQASASGDSKAGGGALDSTRRVADAVSQGVVPGAAASVSNSVFDGVLGRPDLSAAPAVSASSYGSRRVPAAAGKTTSSSLAQGLSGKALFDKLHENTAKGFKKHEYGEAQNFLFGTADQVVVDGKAGVIDAYSGVFKPGKSTEGGDYPENGDQNGDGHVDREGMNVEHIWPQSFFAKLLPFRSDMHHLMATFMHPNSIRGHLPFGEVRGGGDYSNSAGAKRGQGVFEPPNISKGRVARSLLYFYVRYNDRNITNGAFGDDFWNTKLEMLLRWNRQFPPTDWEKKRNPFVDDHTLADQIGVDALMRRPRIQFHERARNQRRQRRR